MEQYKPVHLISSLKPEQLLERVQKNGIQIEALAEDETRDEGYHTHAYLAWPIGRTRDGNAVLKPKKPNWIRGIRNKYGCTYCRTSQSGAGCPCGLYIKAKFPKCQDHVDHCIAYINRKPKALLKDIGGVFHRREWFERQQEGSSNNERSDQVPNTE